MRCRNASASGPRTQALVSEVRSNIAVRSRVARCSVAALADQNIPAQPSRRAAGIRPVDVEPLRPLEALALEELGAQLLELLVERRGPQRPGHAQGLERVDEVVHLVVVAGAAGTHVGARRLDRLEAVDVHLVDVEARVAVGDPVGHDPTDPAAVGDPHGLGDPRAADARGRTHDREPVGGEREHPVEGEVEGRRGERRQEPAGVGPGGVEVLRRPGRERGHVLVLAVRVDPGHAGRRRRCRAAGCRAGRRAAGRAGTTRRRSDRRAGGSTSPGPGRASSGGSPRPRAPTSASSGTGVVIVYRCSQGVSGMVDPSIEPSSGPQMPPATTARGVAIVPRSVTTPRSSPATTSNPLTRVDPARCAPAALARRSIASTARSGLPMPSMGTWYDPRISPGSRSGTSERVSSGSMTRAPGMPQLWATPTLRWWSCQRSFVRATSIVPTGRKHGLPSRSSAFMSSTVSSASRVIDARVVGHEHAARGVRGRPAGRRDRPLVDDDDVAPAALGEVVGDRRADDAGTDDHDGGLARQLGGDGQGCLLHGNLRAAMMAPRPAPRHAAAPRRGSASIRG